MKITVSDGYITTVTNENMKLVLKEDYSGYDYEYWGFDTDYCRGSRDSMSQTSYSAIFADFLQSAEDGNSDRVVASLRGDW